MIKKKVLKIYFSETCDKCKKEVIGQTEKECQWNFDVHTKSCKNRKVKKK